MFFTGGIAMLLNTVSKVTMPQSLAIKA